MLPSMPEDEMRVIPVTLNQPEMAARFMAAEQKALVGAYATLAARLHELEARPAPIEGDELQKSRANLRRRISSVELRMDPRGMAQRACDLTEALCMEIQKRSAITRAASGERGSDGRSDEGN